jgi:hypothetical protein
MAQTRLQAALALAKERGIQIDMIEEFRFNQIVVRGKLGDRVYDRRIDRSSVLQTEDLDLLYADAHYTVIDALLQDKKRGFVEEGRIAELERELTKYKAAVKDLSFKLEMAGTGGAIVKEYEVRKFALEQAAEFLMDHGVITTGNDLVEVCEQIKKLSASQAAVMQKDWGFL